MTNSLDKKYQRNCIILMEIIIFNRKITKNYFQINRKAIEKNSKKPFFNKKHIYFLKKTELIFLTYKKFKKDLF